MSDTVMKNELAEKISKAQALMWTAFVKGGQYILMGVGALFTLLAIYKAVDGPKMLWVKSPSLNPGWYIIDPEQPITVPRGTLVRWNFVPPEWLRKSHPGVPPDQHLKRVTGVPGDRIRWEGNQLVVCDILNECNTVGKAIPHDGSGKPFPMAQFPEVIPPDYYLLLADHPYSIDGRYLGLVPITSINGRAHEFSVNHVDYAALQKEADAFFASHPISDYKDGQYVGHPKTAAIPASEPASKAR